MQFATLLSVATAALLTGTAQAVWCQFYTDSACTKFGDHSTSYNAGDSSVFSDNGNYVQCHRSTATCNNVTVTRMSGGKAVGTTNVLTLSPTYDLELSACYSTGGNGPQYQLTSLPIQQSCLTT